MSTPILTSIGDTKQFQQLLSENPGELIVKFGAEWCGPCKRIEKDVKATFERMPSTVQTAIVDIDEELDVYAFLKTKKMVNGIPAILCWKKGNTSYIPDDSVLGADLEQLRLFFDRRQK
uniref:Thioredoxin domain-containing protein n=1 Tax=viral metagenome TaxID=1070528 RepID=A0A6C0I552_9ZZZZ